jgi:hypothetical protein
MGAWASTTLFAFLFYTFHDRGSPRNVMTLLDPLGKDMAATASFV